MIPVSEFKEGLDFSVLNSSLDEVVAVTREEEIVGGLSVRWVRDVGLASAVAWFDNKIWYGTSNGKVSNLGRQRAVGSRPGKVVRLYVHDGVLYDLCVENHKSLLVYRTVDNDFLGTLTLKTSGVEAKFNVRVPHEGVAISADAVLPYVADISSDGVNIVRNKSRFLQLEEGRVILPHWCERTVTTKNAVYGIPQDALGVYAHSRIDPKDSRMMFAGSKIIDFAVRYK